VSRQSKGVKKRGRQWPPEKRRKREEGEVKDLLGIKTTVCRAAIGVDRGSAGELYN